ncbi:MAG: ABC transporter permease [Chloroflexi bacterium]|nr:MAG: ABC transporter permease [Chloroflexota bacterium]
MAVVSQVVTPEVVTKRQPTGALIRRALQLRRTQIGLGLVLVILAIAIIGPHIAPHGGNDFVGTPNSLKVPGALFGTDHIGQDVWSRFLHGGLTILVLGIAVGLVAAYSRNVLDDILMRAMDVILAFPQIMLALVAIATVGPNPVTIILAVGLTTMPRVARVTRGASQPVVERDFVAAAEAIGVPRFRILLSEIFPNVLSPLLVEASLRLTYAIGVIAALAFLGFTTNPGAADWGLMIQENYIALTVQPWGVVLPVAAIALLTVGTGLIGDGIARAAAGIDRVRGAA